MKLFTLNFINSNGKLVSFNASQPETNEEIMAGLGIYPQTEAMVFFPISPDVCLQPCLFNNHTDNVDTLYVDWMGNIKPKSYPDAVCRIELTLGLCKTHNINPGDSVIHDRFHILPDNTINIKGYKFEKVTLDVLKSIKPEDVLIIENSNSGSKDMIRQSAILITKQKKFYYIDYSVSEQHKVFSTLISKTSLFELCSNVESTLLINGVILSKLPKISSVTTLNDVLNLLKL